MLGRIKFKAWMGGQHSWRRHQCTLIHKSKCCNDDIRNSQARVNYGGQQRCLLRHWLCSNFGKACHQQLGLRSCQSKQLQDIQSSHATLCIQQGVNATNHLVRKLLFCSILWKLHLSWLSEVGYTFVNHEVQRNSPCQYCVLSLQVYLIQWDF